VQGREKVGPLRLEVHGVTLLASALTIRQSTQHGHKNKKAYRVNNLKIITNSQNLYICDISLFLQYLTPLEHMFIISSILTVAEGSSNNIYDVVNN